MDGGLMAFKELAMIYKCKAGGASAHETGKATCPSSEELLELVEDDDREQSADEMIGPPPVEPDDDVKWPHPEDDVGL
jgi:hypothetical protein